MKEVLRYEVMGGGREDLKLQAGGLEVGLGTNILSIKVATWDKGFVSFFFHWNFVG